MKGHFPNLRIATSSLFLLVLSFFIYLLIYLLCLPLVLTKTTTDDDHDEAHRISKKTEPRDTLPTTEPSSVNGKTTKSPSRWQAALSHFKTEITIEHADIPIIACCLVSGLCDSSAYNAWSCFVSMQTGSSSPPPPAAAHISNSVFR